jgi:hypothetical protein
LNVDGVESGQPETAHGEDNPGEEEESSPNVEAIDEYSRHNAARTDFDDDAVDGSDDELVDT